MSCQKLHTDYQTHCLLCATSHCASKTCEKADLRKLLERRSPGQRFCDLVRQYWDGETAGPLFWQSIAFHAAKYYDNGQSNSHRAQFKGELRGWVVYEDYEGGSVGGWVNETAEGSPMKTSYDVGTILVPINPNLPWWIVTRDGRAKVLTGFVEKGELS